VSTWSGLILRPFLRNACVHTVHARSKAPSCEAPLVHTICPTFKGLLWETRFVHESTGPSHTSHSLERHVLLTSPASLRPQSQHTSFSPRSPPIASIGVLERNAYLPPFSIAICTRASLCASVCAPRSFFLRFFQRWPPLAPQPAARHLHKNQRGGVDVSNVQFWPKMAKWPNGRAPRGQNPEKCYGHYGHPLVW